jgi:hypothetical protein
MFSVFYEMQIGKNLKLTSVTYAAGLQKTLWNVQLSKCFHAVFLLASSTLMMEATCSSETSVDFQRTTRRYIPEDRTLHNHWCENLKSYYIWNCLFLQHAYPDLLGLFTLLFQGWEPWQLNQCKDWLQTGRPNASSINLSWNIYTKSSRAIIRVKMDWAPNVSEYVSLHHLIKSNWWWEQLTVSENWHGWFIWLLTEFVCHNSSKSNSVRFRYASLGTGF